VRPTLAEADVKDMNEGRGEAVCPEGDDELAMQLLADGVPLQLLVDIALPLTLIRELFSGPDRAVQS